MEHSLASARRSRVTQLLGAMTAPACGIALAGFCGRWELLDERVVADCVLDLLAFADESDASRLMRIHDLLGTDRDRASKLLCGNDEGEIERARIAWLVVLFEEVLDASLAPLEEAIEIQDLVLGLGALDDTLDELDLGWWRQLTDERYSEKAVAETLRRAIGWLQAMQAMLQAG